MMLTPLWVFFLLGVFNVILSQTFVSLEEGTSLRGSNFSRPYRIEDTTDPLQDILTLTSTVPMRDRLAVIILLYYRVDAERNRRSALLHCSLTKLFMHMQPHTPMDVFIFVDKDTRDNLPSWLQHDFESIHILLVDSKSWALPTNLSPSHLWAAPAFNDDYRSMGRWRMSFAPDFARALGYKYLLNMDVDLFMLQGAPFARNLVTTFNQKQVAFAFRNRMLSETTDVVEGIPELVKFWMTTRKVKAPWGPLLEQFSPASLDTISSTTWNCVSYENSFHVINTDFWFEPPVQDFLHLVFATGSDIMQRWNEQAVMNAMRLLFLPPERLYIFPQQSMVHVRIRDSRLLGLLQCDTAESLLAAHQAETQTQTHAAHLHPDVNTVEFILHFDTDVPIDVLTEFPTFYFAYNLSSCGKDTFALSGLEFSDVIIQTSPLHPKPDILTDLQIAYDKLLTNYFAYDENGRVLEGAGCADIVRLQLSDHFAFYCLYMSAARPDWWLHECNLNRATALDIYDRTKLLQRAVPLFAKSAVALTRVNVILGAQSSYALELAEALVLHTLPSVLVEWFVLDVGTVLEGTPQVYKMSRQREVRANILSPDELTALRSSRTILLLSVLDCADRNLTESEPTKQLHWTPRSQALLDGAARASNAFATIFLSGEPTDLSAMNSVQADVHFVTTTNRTMLPAPNANTFVHFLPVFAASFFEMHRAAVDIERKSGEFYKPHALLQSSDSRFSGCIVGDPECFDGHGSKSRGVAYLYHRCDRAQREQFFDILRKTALQSDEDNLSVHALGRCKGNGYSASSHPQMHGAELDVKSSRDALNYVDLAIEAYKPYKFVIAFENSFVDGYITEKLTNAYLAGSVPIYFGAPDVGRYFNAASMINCADFASLGDCAHRVVQVHRNATLYHAMLHAAPMVNITAWSEAFPWESSSTTASSSKAFTLHLRRKLNDH